MTDDPEKNKKNIHKKDDALPHAYLFYSFLHISFIQRYFNSRWNSIEELLANSDANARQTYPVSCTTNPKQVEDWAESPLSHNVTNYILSSSSSSSRRSYL